MRNRVLRTLGEVLALALVAGSLAGCAREAPAPQSPHPYDETLHAVTALEDAFARAGSDREVLIVYGANWCPECRKLEAQMLMAPLSQQLAGAYEIVKIDIGRFDRNEDVIKTYGSPTAKGIPAAAIAKIPGQPARTIDGPTLSLAATGGSDTLWRLLKP